MPKTVKKKKAVRKPADRSKVSVFKKLVVSPGDYQIRGEQHSLSADDLKQFAKNGAKMLSKGIQIPAPFAHLDEKGNIPAPVNMSDGGVIIDEATGEPIGWRSDLNAGYVTSFDYGELSDPETGETKEGVIATFEIDGSDEDAESAAYKVGRTIRETSAGIRSSYVDGKGEAYEGYSPLHVALVNNPVEFGQSNFALAMNDTLLMATPVADDPSTSGSVISPRESPLSELIQLCQSCSIDLPDDTTDKNLVERLTLLMKQRLSDLKDNSSSDQLSQQPNQGQAPNAPIAMSEANQPVLKTIDIMLSSLVHAKKLSLKERADNLVSSGRVTRKWVDENLTPRIDAVMMSAETFTQSDIELLQKKNELPRAEVEGVIEALESTAGQDLTQMSENANAPAGHAPGKPSFDAANRWYKDANDLQDNGEVDEESDKELFAQAASYF